MGSENDWERVVFASTLNGCAFFCKGFRGKILKKLLGERCGVF